MDQHFLSNYLDASEHEIPLDLPTVFGRESETYLEVGFGSGEFLVQKAIDNSAKDFLGVELSVISTEKLLKSLKRELVENVRVLLTDASFCLNNVIPKDSLSGVYMNFPCPWPKKRHSNRRLNDPNFVLKIGRVLKKGGFFQLYSDSKEFISEMSSSVDLTGLFDSVTVEINPTAGVGTRYERKWLAMQREIFRLICRRNSKAVNCEEDVVNLSHLWVKNIDKSRLDRVAGRSFSSDEMFVKFMGVYRKLDNEVFLIETLSVDRGYSQRFYISLSKREEVWLIQLDSQAKPFRTRAVKFAVRTLSRILGDESRA